MSGFVDDMYVQFDTYRRMQKVFGIDIFQYLLQTCKVWFEEEEFTPETLCVLLTFDILDCINMMLFITRSSNAIP